jgi:hypothetical protein
MWAKLRRCFDYAEVELSNNLAENSMRPVALGRKNWLHVGSAHAGPKVAAILSVVESCRRLGVPVKEYLAAVLPGLNRRTLPEVANLHPSPLVGIPHLTPHALGWSDAYDEAVDKLYRPAAFRGDRDRVEHLFGLYERLVAPLVAASRPARRKSRN